MNSFRAQHRAILPDPPAEDSDTAADLFERRLLALCLDEAERVVATGCVRAKSELVHQVAGAMAATIAAVTRGHTAASVILAQEIAVALPELAARRAGAVRQSAAERAETRQ